MFSRNYQGKDMKRIFHIIFRFNAVVSRQGHGAHPAAPVVKAVVGAPALAHYG